MSFKYFFGAAHVFLYLNVPELGAGIDPCIALSPIPSSVLDEMR